MQKKSTAGTRLGVFHPSKETTQREEREEKKTGDREKERMGSRERNISRIGFGGPSEDQYF